jgi:hypothetical protein
MPGNTSVSPRWGGAILLFYSHGLRIRSSGGGGYAAYQAYHGISAQRRSSDFISIYMDDSNVVGATQEEATEAMDLAITAFQLGGWNIQWKKSDL